MENYKLTQYNVITRLSDGASIPLAEDNSDYKTYLDWVAEGNVPLPADPVSEPTYAELRAAAYPPITELIDGLVKDDAKQVQAYKDACLAIKKKFPKP